MNEDQKKKFTKALVESIKAWFFSAAKGKIIQILVAAGLRMTGPIGWIASLVINKVLSALWAVAYKFGIKKKNEIAEKIETQKELKEYAEKIEDPNASAEDIKKAGKDFISS